MSETSKPFGLSFLTEVPAAELAHVNGGQYRHRPGYHVPPAGSTGTPTPPPTGAPNPPGLQTMYVSMPQPAFPTGDHG